MTSQFWLWLDTFAMAIGGGLILVMGKRRTPTEEGHTIYHGIVPLIAACAYLAMAMGQGQTLLPTAVAVDPAAGIAAVATRDFYWARYVDWSFTTPLLLLPLGQLAMHSSMRRPDLVAGLLLADLMMILTALFFGFSVEPWVRWTWFIVSCGAFLAVYWVMWVPLLREASLERAEVRSNYVRNAAILSVLWVLYPLILLFGTDGLGIMSPVLSVALIAIIDFVSKVIYGFVTAAGFKKIVDHDLSEMPARQRAA